MECMKFGMPGLTTCFENKVMSEYLLESSKKQLFNDMKYLEIEVSDRMAGRIIGRRGNNIQDLRREFDCEILLSREQENRILYINGIDKFRVLQRIWCM